MVGAQRAIWRIAWRDGRRNRGRSVLVLVMVAVPVMLLVAGVAVAGAVSASPDQTASSSLGKADALIYLTDESSLSGAHLPAGVMATSYRMGADTFTEQGELLHVDIVETDLHDPITAGMVSVLDGRLPSGPGEAVITAELASRSGLGIGDRVPLDTIPAAIDVAGIVRNPERLSAVGLLAAPGTFASEDFSWNALVTVPPMVSIDDVAASFGAESAGYTPRETHYRNDSEVAAFGGGFILTAVALFGTGLIISAAFAVSARRQLRMFGLVGAIGGEPAHVRRLVTAGGTAFGLVGSVLGTVAGGLLGWGVVQLPAFRNMFDRIFDPYVVSPVLVAGAIGLGTIAASLAAAIPAMAAARIPTTDALAERMPTPRSSTRLAQLGLVLVVGGGAAMAWATMQHQFELVALSLIVMLIGFLAAIPLVVSWLGRIAVRLPMEERIAARSTARHARRTAASLSAAVLALSLPVAVGALTLSMEAHDNANPGLAADQAVIGYVSTEEELPMETAAIAASIPGSIVDILDHAVQRPDGATEDFWGYHGIWGSGADLIDDGGEVYKSGAQVIVGDATTLAVMHAETAITALEAGKAIGINVQPRNGFVELETAVFNPTPVPGAASQDPELEYIELPAVGVELDYGRLDNAFTYWVISPQVAAELGFDTAPLGGALMRAPHELDAADLDEVAAAAEATGNWSYGLASSQRSDGGIRMAITAVSMMIALVIVAITVALVAAESRREQALLVALGAEPASRRRIVGAGAAMLAALAAVVAVPAGLVPVSVALVSRQAGYPITVPWATVGLVLLAVPLLAGAVAALLSRPAKTARTMASIA